MNATSLIVQIADGSCNDPIGIAEDVPIKIGDVIFPTDFVVLDVLRDSNIPLILGRPLLNSVDTIIHVSKKRLDLGVG